MKSSEQHCCNAMITDSSVVKCDCSPEVVVGVEYCILSPNHYDGVSEWRCSTCNRRWGRWSGKELAGDEEEIKFGGD